MSEIIGVGIGKIKKGDIEREFIRTFYSDGTIVWTFIDSEKKEA